MNKPRYWLVVPAAGAGQRFGSELPKQYREIAGRCVLAHALQAFADWGNVSGTLVVINNNDRWLTDIAGQLPLAVKTTVGGAERMQSVINGIRALADEADEQDWVLIHDAARPCLCVDDLRNLVAATVAEGVGGLLACRVADTLKKARDENGPPRVLSTMDRQGLWQALTPQLFPYGPLGSALESAQARGEMLGDEAAAMELAGHRPFLI
ncbi:MAG: 2-C-methyl-D-erythritol 4-phosphate cytidylyltransferase [Gammaproteobacteria bacterium]|nr:2-C-methyl-D-erythritol 4-phosphate cytidylyltransferase [Gammaproteobacteria bacterium]